MNGEGFESAYQRHRLTLPLASRSLPVRTIPIPSENQSAYRGMCQPAPYDYEVSVAIPTINSSARLPLVIELLRLQTIRPFIIIVDTGSTPEEFSKIEGLRAQDVEVHSLRLNGVSNSSEPVSMAMDLAFAVCRTRFMFCTHDDCFLRSRIVLQYLRDVADSKHVAGHQLTSRPHVNWREMVGHTCTMFDVDFCVDRGFSWNMRRLSRANGLPGPDIDSERPNWPDTEIGMNVLLLSAGIKPFLTGTEKNFARNKDAMIDHCRSYGSCSIYDADRMEILRKSMNAAMTEARDRIEEWSDEPVVEARPLPKIAKITNPLPEFIPNFDYA